MYLIEKILFSKDYRNIVAKLKKIIRDDEKEGRKLDDIRASEGAGRKGPADRPPNIPKVRHTRRDSGKESGSTDNKEEENRNAGTAPAPIR